MVAIGAGPGVHAKASEHRSRQRPSSFIIRFRWTHDGTRVWPIRAPHGGRGPCAQDAVDLGAGAHVHGKRSPGRRRRGGGASYQRALRNPKSAADHRPAGRPVRSAAYTRLTTSYRVYSFLKRKFFSLFGHFIFAPSKKSFSFSSKEQSTFFF